MTAPERIWAESPDIFDGMGIWHESGDGPVTEYHRSDLTDARITEAVKAALGDVIAEIDSHERADTFRHYSTAFRALRLAILALAADPEAIARIVNGVTG